MKVRFLGTAAGGGAPQWNCGCRVCEHARRDGVSRTQDGLAVSGDGRSWYLVNASPDLRTQLLAAPELRAPPGTRDTPIRGVLLTSAELDHTLGLLSLRETTALDVHATASVHEALKSAFPIEGVLAGYTRVRELRVRDGEPFDLDGGLRVTAVVLSGKRPRYAAGLPRGDWVSAYRFETSRGVFVYAPGLSTWHTGIVSGADVVVLDGTFLTEDEMGPDRPASGMGHLAVREVLPLLGANPGPRYVFTHLNNTNPLVLPDAPELAELTEVNASVAADGQLLEI
jgi:pyrroloquinoline quinone biosynthesis protein B